MAMITNDWLPALQEEFEKPYYTRVVPICDKKNTVPQWYILRRMIFSMHFILHRLEEVKVLILGTGPIS